MKYICYSLIFALLFIGCKKRCKSNSLGFNPIKEKLYYHDNSTLWKGLYGDTVDKSNFAYTKYDFKNWHPYFSNVIIDGDRTTFEYYYRNEGCEYVADDEYEFEFCFRIKIKGNEFIINQPDQLNRDCTFDESYFGCPKCCFKKFKFINGKIEGNKNDEGNWKIKTKVYYSCMDSLKNLIKPVKIEFEGIFIKHNPDSCRNFVKKLKYWNIL